MTGRLLIFLILITLSAAQGQILDDTTRQIYGPHTTRYVLEEDILNNTGRTYAPDTALYNFHWYENFYTSDNIYQNLGNLGTALRGNYYQPATMLGKRLGITIYDAYAVNPLRVRYYDTQSPYTDLYYVQGWRGQQIVAADFSRNIRPNWNFGFGVKRMTANKIIGSTQARDLLTDHYSVVAHTRYVGKRYHLMTNFSHLLHTVEESGGLAPDTVRDEDEMLQNFGLHPVHLRSSRAFGPRTYERRYHYHLFHQYALFGGNALHIYHIGDYHKRVNRFIDRDITTGDTAYYPDPIFTHSEVKDRLDYETLESQVGIKGALGKNYYRIYYKNRYLSLRQNFLHETALFYENYVGGFYSLRFDSLSSLDLTGEYMVAGFGDDYNIRAQYRSKFLDAGYYRVFNSPTLVQRLYYSNFFVWANEFENTLSDNVWVKADVNAGKRLNIVPWVSYSMIRNYIYFDTLARPAQTNETIRLLQASLQLSLRLGKFGMENRVIWSNLNGPDVIRFPEIFNHFRIFYRNWVFKKAALLQIGAEVFYRSSYYSYNYMPLNMQYHLNDQFVSQAYPLADFFINLKIRRAMVFVKLAHFNQGMTGPGYYITPYYPAMPRSLDFGIRWMFFD
ncbi:MAG: putative porin [Cytophagaceae bacterium]